MSYITIEDVIKTWALDNEQIVLSLYKDCQVRSFEVLNAEGKKFQIWIENEPTRQPMASAMPTHLEYEVRISFWAMNTLWRMVIEGFSSYVALSASFPSLFHGWSIRFGYFD